MVDVIICCYNRNHFLEETLPRLKDCDVILVDDGSANLLSPGAYPQIRKLLWTRHVNYQRVARFNEGIRQVLAPHVILLDDDCVPLSERFVQAHVATLEQCDVSRGMIHDGRPMLPPWFSTCNIGFRSEILFALDGFDERFNGGYGYDDDDMGRRIDALGLRVGSGSPDTAVYHKGIISHADRSLLERNRLLFEAKWKTSA